jgi:molybdenum cofactor biosynthesis protein B
MRVAIVALSEEAPSGLASERLIDAGHRVVECELCSESDATIRARLEHHMADPVIDVVLVLGGSELAVVDQTREAIAPLVTRGLPGFGELVRWVSFSQLDAAAMLNRASAALCGSTLVIALPGSPALVTQVIDRVLVPQLAASATGATLAMLLPAAGDARAGTKPPPTPRKATPPIPPTLPKTSVPPATVKTGNETTQPLAKTAEPTLEMPKDVMARPAFFAVESVLPAPPVLPLPKLPVEAAPELIAGSSTTGTIGSVGDLTSKTRRRSGVNRGVFVLAALAVAALAVAAYVVISPPGTHEAASAPIAAPDPAPPPAPAPVPPTATPIEEPPPPPPTPVVAATDPKPGAHPVVAPKPKTPATEGSADATPVADESCNEAACALDHYQRECCAPYKEKHPAPTGDELPESLDPGLVRTATAAVRSSITACGDKSPGVTGVVKVHVEVGADGNVTSTTIRETPDPALGDCVSAVLHAVHFARTQQGGSFTYPAQFAGG